MRINSAHSAPRGFLHTLTAALTAAAFVASTATAFAQPPPPPPEAPPAPPEGEYDEPPPEDEPPPPPRRRRRPPPRRYDDGRQPPPPGYGPPPPGYGPPPDPYNYGVPPGTPSAYDADDWEEGDPVPPGYRVDTRVRKGLVIGGAVTLGALWVLSVLTGAIAVSVEEADDSLDSIDDDFDSVGPEDWYPMFIPVAGPFVTIVTAETSGVGTAFLIIDGIGQAGGLAMLIAGLAAQETYIRPVPQYGDLKIELAPVVAPNFTGMGIKGTF